MLSNYFNSTFRRRKPLKEIRKGIYLKRIEKIRRLKGDADKSIMATNGLRKAPLRGRGKLPLLNRMKRTRHGLQEARWSREVRERDNYTCQFPGCGKQGKSLDTHHIAMRSLRPDLRFDVNNGLTLCRRHHSWVSQVENRDEAIALGLLNLETYESAMKRKAVA